MDARAVADPAFVVTEAENVIRVNEPEHPRRVNEHGTGDVTWVKNGVGALTPREGQRRERRHPALHAARGEVDGEQLVEKEHFRVVRQVGEKRRIEGPGRRGRSGHGAADGSQSRALSRKRESAILAGEARMIPYDYSKIIATVGPATATVDGIRSLIRAGADACRVNFSHGNGETLGPLMQLIREAARLENAVVAILADIQGPKLRIGAMPRAGALLVQGTEFTLTTRAVEGTDTFAEAAYEHLAQDVEPGARILLADGAIELEVEAIDVDGADTSAAASLRVGTCSRTKA